MRVADFLDWDELEQMDELEERHIEKDEEEIPLEN